MSILTLLLLEKESELFPVAKTEDLQQWVEKINDSSASSRLQHQMRTLLKIFTSSRGAEGLSEGVMKLLSLVQKLLDGEDLLSE